MLLFYLNNLYPLFYDYEKFIINLIFFSIDYAIGNAQSDPGMAQVIDQVLTGLNLRVYFLPKRWRRFRMLTSYRG